MRGSLSWEPVLLSLAVALWAGSFDILYHVQDREFHIREGLHSVARTFGIVAAVWASRALDVTALLSLLALGLWMELDWPYYLGLALAGVLLAYKHRLVRPSDISRLDMAFFRVNAYVSTSMLTATLAAVLI